MTMIFPQEEVDEGLRRIGLSKEARFLTQLLLTELHRVAPAHSDICALSELNGRRSFASELLRALGPGTASNRTEENASTAADLARNPAQRRGSPVSQPGGARRRVPDEPE